jgi:hypothetical protein
VCEREREGEYMQPNMPGGCKNNLANDGTLNITKSWGPLFEKKKTFQLKMLGGKERTTRVFLNG